MEPIVAKKELRLRAPPGELWPLVSNSNRINRALGVAPITMTEGGGFALCASSKLLGMTVRWIEPPWDYAAGRFYVGERLYENGPIERFEGGIRLEPDGAGSRAEIFATFEPRGRAAGLLLGLAAPKALDSLAAELVRLDESLGAPRPKSIPRSATPADETALAPRAKILLGAAASRAAAEKLVERIRTGYDDEVLAMRPYELADAWSLPRRDVLAACLHAVKAGLLELRWEVLCPNCSGAKLSLSSLSELKGKAHCGSCGIQYGVGLDEAVELRVSVHPSVRAATAATFCVGSPAHSRSALAQLKVRPGEEAAATVELPSGSLRLRGLANGASVALRPSADGPSELSIDLANPPSSARFKPGAVRLRVRAPAKELVRVEAEDWRAAGATAAEVASMQEFRDLFSSEVLAPGIEIGVRRLALLFTDLKGSTALYERVGDASAYGVVREHFGWLTERIAERRGAVVKTIGDAVMAVFTSGADALEAALDMQERIAELDARLAPREPVVLKIGVHEGPAIAINAGGVLDYFGTTANFAARVQAESEGGDVVITDELRQDPGCRAVLDRRRPEESSFDAEVRGLTGKRRLWRLLPSRRPASS